MLILEIMMNEIGMVETMGLKINDSIVEHLDDKESSDCERECFFNCTKNIETNGLNSIKAI